MNYLGQNDITIIGTQFLAFNEPVRVEVSLVTKRLCVRTD